MQKCVRKVVIQNGPTKSWNRLEKWQVDKQKKWDFSYKIYKERTKTGQYASCLKWG